jgi:hypothetical protein
MGVPAESGKAAATVDGAVEVVAGAVVEVARDVDGAACGPAVPELHEAVTSAVASRTPRRRGPTRALTTLALAIGGGAPGDCTRPQPLARIEVQYGPSTGSRRLGLPPNRAAERPVG